MPITISLKPYRCERGHVHNESTNHYGEIYSRCPTPGCASSIRQFDGEIPEGGWVPEPWKQVKLGDVIKFETPPIMQALLDGAVLDEIDQIFLDEPVEVKS